MDVEMGNSTLPADQPTDWIRVYSQDGFSFLVKRSVLLDSANSYKESRARTCVISERAVIVEKLIDYMSFKAHYMTRSGKEEIPVNEFLERIPPEIVLELLLAADYHARRIREISMRDTP
ncbi:hypothetical protein BD626DRAFT_556357 [Schizophyllum amplum]|uniref:Elongin-C n=1 Tax=Schizophyllum amplum TaxID=97359 RepID=A0A550CK43_9AGAR|nr:hypothetical protein BD626DRAFT_556357 [Auriculariopsis ampla]